MNHKKCTQCKTLLPVTTIYFARNRASKDGFRYACKVCKYYVEIKGRYGLTKKEYLTMYNKQKGRCALCSRDLYLMTQGKKTSIHIDHDHRTGKVRGMLCMNCNVNLGWYSKRKEKIEDYVRTE